MGNLESRDKDVEELRAEVSCQSDCYNDLSLVHETSLEEAQKLRSDVIALRSGIRVESAEGWLEARTGTLRVLAPSPGGRVVSRGDRLIMLRTPTAGMRDLSYGQRIEAVAIGGDNGANPLLYA